MPEIQSEQHPLASFLPKDAKILMMGSFPPPKTKWRMEFYYPNFQNDMWRIFGLVFFDDKDYFILEGNKSFDKDKIIDFLNDKGVALYDTAQVVRRLKGNASDNYLEIVETADIQHLLNKLPSCNTLVTTGEKATDTLCSLFRKEIKKPLIGNYVDVEFIERQFRFYRMPSSSRAYPKPLTEKAEVYRNLFAETGLI